MPNTFILCTILENELKSSNHPAYADIPRESNGSEQFNQNNLQVEPFEKVLMMHLKDLIQGWKQTWTHFDNKKTMKHVINNKVNDLNNLIQTIMMQKPNNIC